MIDLGIHQMSALDAEPADFIGIAAGAGFQSVSLFVRQVSPGARFPMVSARDGGNIRQQLRDSGLQLNQVDAFTLLPDTDIREYEPALELGAELGARGATALIFDTEPARVEDKLSRLCELAAAMELRLAVEFLASTPAWNNLESVAELAATMGAYQLGLGLDVLHLVRSGASADDLRALPAEAVAYAQLCDGGSLAVTQDYASEAAGDRLAPGDGCFPLAEYLQALPADTPLELEVPQPHTVPARERVRQIAERSRAFLAACAAG